MNYLRTHRVVLVTALLGTALLAAQEQNPNAKKAAPKAAPKKPASATPPDMTNVVYGSDQKFNVIDLWQAKSDKPTPLVIFIHGGGFGGGDKDKILSQLPLDELIKAGVSCTSIDYRRLQSKPGPRQIIYPTLFLDCARAVQFLRYKAKEWNLDPTRFACAGGSAGAGMSLWIGFHKDLADPKSDDPVASAPSKTVLSRIASPQRIGRGIVYEFPATQAADPTDLLTALSCPQPATRREAEEQLRAILHAYRTVLPLPAAAIIHDRTSPDDMVCNDLLSVLTVLAKSSGNVFLRDKEPNLDAIIPGKRVIVVIPSHWRPES